MRRMEVYSKNHDIFNIIYVIMCMGRAGAIGFFHVVNAESWRLGIGNDHEKNSVGALPMEIAVRTPQMGFQDRCTKGQGCPLLATSART